VLLLLGRTFFAGKTEITYQLELKMVFTIKLIMVAVVPPLSRTVDQVTGQVTSTYTTKVERESEIKRK